MSIEENSKDLKEGYIIKSGNFMLTKKIKSLDEFYEIISEDDSVFARHRMYPTSFFFSWQIKLIKNWINQGLFYRAIKIKNKNKNKK